jgi:hypothetical protein
VDFLGLHRGRDLYFIEAKDYRGSPIALKNNEKLCEGDTLRLQMARKVKDSAACVAGAGTNGHPALLPPVARCPPTS